MAKKKSLKIVRNLNKEDITGRDWLIVSQALQIAIPTMLRHSGSASNIIDMIKLLDALGGKNASEKYEGGSLGYLEQPMVSYLIDVLKEVKKGVTLAKGMGIDIEFVNKLYFTNVEEYPTDAVLH